MTSGSQKRTLARIPWNRVVAIAGTVFMVWFLFFGNHQVCSLSESGGGSLVKTCRPYGWGDPGVVFAAFLVAILLGIEFRSLSWGDKVRIEFSQTVPKLTGMTELIEGSHESDFHDSAVGLILLGSAAEVNQIDAYLFVFYHVIDGKVAKYWSSAPTAMGGKKRATDRSMEAIAGSFEMIDFAVSVSTKSHTESKLMTPFPDRNTLVRRCVAVPVLLKDEACLGTLLAVAVQDDHDEMLLGKQMLANHLEKCADVLASASFK